MLLVRTAWRSLRHTPWFTATTILVLGLGLGANLILFNAVHALLWRPLPFADPDHLLTLRVTKKGGEPYTSASGRNASDLRQRVPSISSVGLVRGNGSTTLVLGSDKTLDLESAQVNSHYLTALGFAPLAGRFFGEDEDFGRAGERRAVLAESTWRHVFGADPKIAGRVVTFLEGAERRSLRIVGVYPDRLTLPWGQGTQLLTPIPWRLPGVANNPGDSVYQLVLRVKPEASVAAVSAQATAALQATDQELPEGQRGGKFELIPLRSALVSDNTPAWLLYSAAGLLLLLTTINVASLFLTRALGRRHESGVRIALGASFQRTLSEQVLEALFVCAGGLVVALALNAYARDLVPRFLPELRKLGPELLDTSWTLVLFGAGMSIVVACALALLPLRESRRVDLVAVLSEGARTSSGRNRWRGVLAAAQLAVILVLLSLGGLIGRSFLAALSTDPGFDASHAFTLRASIPGNDEGRPAAATELARVVSGVPGTLAVGFSNERPLLTTYLTTHAAHPGDFAATDPSLPFRMVDGGYFRALGLRLLKGRVPTEPEVVAMNRLAVLNESAARILFGRADPIGRQVHSGLGGMWLTVVGLVRDARTEGLDVAAPPMVYRTYLPLFTGDVIYTVRTTRAVDDCMAALQQRAKAWNAGVILRDATPLDEQLRETVAKRRHASLLVAAFALLGLLVGTVGLYGTVAAYAQGLRRELGIRMALGASSRNVLSRVFGHGVRVVVPGALAGLAASCAAASLVRKQLYGIGPWDLTAFAAALLLLAAATLLASLVPAWRASRISPAEALHQR